uniref:Putative outer membrane salicin receptor n=1 Tax=Niveispirillum irakense TaxID=34011 RepID=Q9LAE4_NIVIR|nr:putative outer membrane salicin receptor [Niveispirillum irakense DSM 11586]
MRKSSLMAGAAIATLLPALPVLAQQADTLQLDEIVVTAQRRAENLQETPLAVSAITGEGLASQGIKSVVDLSAQVPSLQITSSGSGASQVFMRGIGSSNVTEVGDPAIAYHIDGIYIARATSTGALFYDIDRVEVLRWSAGTLYGRNATAGAINVITKKPTQELGGSAAIEYGNYNALTTSGVLNVPIKEDLAIRGAFQTTRHDGYQKVITTGPLAGNDKYDQDDKSGRLQALWTPTERLSVNLRGDYLHRGGAGGGEVGYPARTSSPWTSLSTVNTSRDNTYWSTGAEVNLDLDWAELTYIFSYNYANEDRNAENVVTGAPNYFYGVDKTTSNELRLGGDTESLKWVIGAYHFKEDNDVDFRIFLADNNYLSFIQPEVTSETTAVFGQATWSVTEALRLTGGLRYTEDKKGRTGGTFFTNNSGAITGTVTLNVSDNKWNKVNWRAGVDYDLAEGSMAYANVATGYKAGGYYDGLPPNDYKPESITSYEVGVKNRFMDNRLQLNLAGFYYDYRDFQISAIGTIAGQDATVTLNADKAEIYGLELEGDFLLTEQDRFDASVSWLHARYKDFLLPRGDAFANNNANANIARCYTADYSSAPPRAADFSGCKMARTPEWSINLGYQHKFEFDNGASLTGRVQTHIESAKYLEYHGFEQNKQDAFTKTDLTLTYAPAEGGWTVMAYVRNLEDENVLTNSNPNATTGFATNGSGDFYAPPRTYGARLSIDF